MRQSSCRFYVLTNGTLHYSWPRSFVDTNLKLSAYYKIDVNPRWCQICGARYPNLKISPIDGLLHQYHVTVVNEGFYTQVAGNDMFWATKGLLILLRVDFYSQIMSECVRSFIVCGRSSIILCLSRGVLCPQYRHLPTQLLEHRALPPW